MCTTITVFEGYFSNNKFNGDLSKWDTSSVTDISYSKTLNHDLLIVLLLIEELHVETNVIFLTILCSFII